MMSELVEIGGTLPLMKMLLDAGLLHGNCMTVTGKTMAQNPSIWFIICKLFLVVYT
jgi:dihydroxy-acid dehydratase